MLDALNKVNIKRIQDIYDKEYGFVPYPIKATVIKIVETIINYTSIQHNQAYQLSIEYNNMHMHIIDNSANLRILFKPDDRNGEIKVFMSLIKLGMIFENMDDDSNRLLHMMIFSEMLPIFQYIDKMNTFDASDNRSCNTNDNHHISTIEQHLKPIVTEIWDELTQIFNHIVEQKSFEETVNYFNTDTFKQNDLKNIKLVIEQMCASKSTNTITFEFVDVCIEFKFNNRFVNNLTKVYKLNWYIDNNTGLETYQIDINIENIRKYIIENNLNMKNTMHQVFAYIFYRTLTSGRYTVNASNAEVLGNIKEFTNAFFTNFDDDEISKMANVDIRVNVSIIFDSMLLKPHVDFAKDDVRKRRIDKIRTMFRDMNLENCTDYQQIKLINLLTSINKENLN